MKAKRFLVSWIVGLLTMFSLSYLWHGIILNDMRTLPVEKSLYLGLMALMYSVLSCVLVYLIANLSLTGRLIVKRLLVGGALGFFIYLIAFTLGVSFSQNTASHIGVDFLWQMLEQGVGAVMIHFVFNIFIEFDKMREFRASKS